MKRARTLMLLALPALLMGCAQVGQVQARIEMSIDKRLNDFCPMGDGVTQDQRVLRAYIVLAMITDSAQSNIRNFSAPGEASQDASLAINRINAAYRRLGTLESRHADPLFMVYRADSIFELMYAAEASLRPALTAGKSALLAPVSGRIGFAREAFLKILEDAAYLDAYRFACPRMNAADLPAVKLRIRERCGVIHDSFGDPGTSPCGM